MISPWKILIVDDDDDVHNALRLRLSYFSFMNRKVCLLNAYNTNEAIEILSSEEGIALILLDVVMEEEDAGLVLVNYIREDLHDTSIRILLRTGQPGLAPDEFVIDNYDINGYFIKGDTDNVLHNCIKTSLREYQDITLRHSTSEQNLSSAVSLAGSIAHEMRTSLGQVRYGLNKIQLLLPENLALDTCFELTKEKIDDFFSSSKQSEEAIDRAFQVINLILYQINNNTIDVIDKTRESIAAVTKQAISEYCYDREEDRGKVLCSLKTDYTASIDKTLYMFVLFNLLKNAFFYRHDSHFTISITVDTGDQYNNVIIHDNGPGIKVSDIPKLFEPFYTSNKPEGTGLGLYFCKRVMNAFDGDIICHSTLNEGTTFTLSFPKVSTNPLENEHLNLHPIGTSTFPNKTLLIVDDHVHNREIIKQHLADCELKILEASTGNEALYIVKNNVCDLILMDLEIGSPDGFETAQLLLSSKDFDTPIIAFSANPSTLHRKKALETGMVGYLNKPVNDSKLLIQQLRQWF